MRCSFEFFIGVTSGGGSFGSSTTTGAGAFFLPFFLTTIGFGGRGF